MTNDDEIDAMLRTAMAARPEPPDATNLAARAIASARAERRAAPEAAVPASIRWLTTLLSVAGVVAVMVAGYLRLAEHAAQSAWSSAAEATSSSSDLAPTLVVGGVGFVLAIAYATLSGASADATSA